MSSTWNEPVNMYGSCPQVKRMQYWTGEKKKRKAIKRGLRKHQRRPSFLFSKHRSIIIQEEQPRSFTCHCLFLKIKKKTENNKKKWQISSATCSSGLRHQRDSNCSSFFLGHHRDPWLFIALHPFPPFNDTVSKAHSERPSSCLFKTRYCFPARYY